MKALLEVLNDKGGEANCNDVIDELASRFGLTPEEREIKDNGQYKFNHMCHTARVRLVRKEALATDSPRGIWSLAKVDQWRQPSTTEREGSETLKKNLHDDLKKKMVEIGNKLGYNTSTEEGPEYRHDVLWRTTPYRTPSHVVEVCEGGVLAKDFASLIWARENWNASGILIVTNDRDFEKATRQLSGQTQITIVKAETVDKLHELIMTDLEFLKSIFSE
ncbi:MAG: hypothetical protein AMJ37_03450 [Dehalococcoidia bacterium DG_18]|nr:MAG: hypothetical protein AMJ37_03450 [Dehalococcoidia bacterium DG_18]